MKNINYIIFTIGLLLLVSVFLILITLYFFDISDISSIYFFLFSFIVIFAFIGAYTHFIGFPINEIKTSIDSLGDGKKFSDIKIQSKNEIGTIANFINQVVKRVDEISGEVQEGRRIAGEVNAAADIQQTLLPGKAPENIVGIDIIARSKSSSEVGGDSFDVLRQGDNTIFFMGDVTGHGVPAGLIAGMANALVSSSINSGFSMIDTFVQTNTILFDKIKTNHFMSAILMRWENINQKLFFTGAGHETIIHFSKDKGVAENIKTGGIALKMIPQNKPLLKETQIDFNVGDCIVIYTDGITEAKNQAGKRYSLDKFTKIIEDNGFKDTKEIFDIFTKDYSDFVEYTNQEDDVTLIIIKNIGQYGSKENIDILASASQDTLHASTWKW